MPSPGEYLLALVKRGLEDAAYYRWPDDTTVDCAWCDEVKPELCTDHEKERGLAETYRYHAERLAAVTLAPDDKVDPENPDYLGRAWFIIELYQAHFDETAEVETVMTDLLADLMHYAAATVGEPIDFGRVIDDATEHFEAESTSNPSK